MAVQRKAKKPTFDRTPPQNIEAERSVLGAMLLNSDAVGSAIEVLRERAEDMFYVPAHQHIYNAVLALYRNSSPVDLVTLRDQLTRDGYFEECGGASYIAELTDAVPTSANVAYYAQIVLDAAILRRVISTCTTMAGEAYGQPDDVNGLLDQVEAEIFAIAEQRQTNEPKRVSDLLKDGIERIEAQMKAQSGVSGLPTGFYKLDEMLSGLQPSDMIILAARPSVGKTAFALNMASHVAVHEQKSVLMFSLEMSKEQLVQRLLCMQGRINTKRLRSGFLAQREFAKITDAADKLTRAPIYIDDTPNIPVLDLRSKARRHAAKHDLDLIIIDYLQLMSGSGRIESRQVEISEISRSVKGIARELGVPVIALSQLSREAEKDDLGMPKLSHLRESGAIEQDADVVLMLARAKDEESGNLIKVAVAKQRNGPTGDLDLIFNRDVQRFENPMDGGGPRPPADVVVPFDGDAPFDGDMPIEETFEEGDDEIPF